MYMYIHVCINIMYALAEINICVHLIKQPHFQESLWHDKCLCWKTVENYDTGITPNMNTPTSRDAHRIQITDRK